MKNTSLKANIMICFFMLVLYYVMILSDRPPQQKIIENTIEYDLIGQIDSIIISAHNSYLSGTYLKLKNSDAFFNINLKEIIYSPQKTHMGYILLKGDSVYKPKNNDTLWVFRNKKLIYHAIIENSKPIFR